MTHASSLRMCVIGCIMAGSAMGSDSVPMPTIPYEPQTYDCARTDHPPVIDGVLESESWDSAPWTDAFVDIVGPARPAPRHRTRVRMLWDASHFYFAAELEEPHLWGTLTERDAIIFHDNDFEVFIDPDGDTHHYYELEINALGTVWDLLLVKPYRDGGPAQHEWDIEGLQSAVHLDGTLNDPADTDRRWTVEIAWPWTSFGAGAGVPSPPRPGDTWRVNFSRVQWHLEHSDGNYRKVMDPEKGKPLAEDNWVWSPQGLVNMHYPEMWGQVRFRGPSGHQEQPRVHPVAEATRRALRQIYYAQRNHRAQHGSFTKDAKDLNLGLPTHPPHAPRITATDDAFEAILVLPNGNPWRIDHEGRCLPVDLD